MLRPPILLRRESFATFCLLGPQIRRALNRKNPGPNRPDLLPPREARCYDFGLGSYSVPFLTRSRARESWPSSWQCAKAQAKPSCRLRIISLLRDSTPATRE